MDLDEDPEPVAQEPIVLNRGLAGERSEELFLLLLLGGRKQQNFCLHVIEPA